MNKEKLLQLFDKELRQEIEYPEARKEVTANVVRFVREAPGMNFVSYTYSDESVLDRVIDQEFQPSAIAHCRIFFFQIYIPTTESDCQIPLTVSPEDIPHTFQAHQEHPAKQED